MNTKIIILCFVLIVTGFNLSAQNQIQLTNYSQVLSFYNPAFCGNTKTLNITALARQQWIGYEKAPSSQILSIDSYSEKISGGLGLTMLNDVLGNENTVNIKVNYSYKYFFSNYICII